VRPTKGEVQEADGVDQRMRLGPEAGRQRGDRGRRGLRPVRVPAHAVDRYYERGVLPHDDGNTILVVFAVPNQAQFRGFDLQGVFPYPSIRPGLLQCGGFYSTRHSMIRSMTGFARRERAGDYGILVWELRTVNHRYLEISMRLPEEIRGAESEFRQIIQGAVRRGKVDASLQLRGGSGGSASLEVDVGLLDELIARSHEVTGRATQRGGSLAQPTPLDLLRWPGVLRDRERDATPLQTDAGALLGETLAALTATRDSEGERIATMLTTRCRQLEELVGVVRARLPEVQARIHTRLAERIQQLALPAEANRDRLEQELSLLLSKMDVDEELDRLTSHVVEVGKSLSGAEPAGRRLDFLMQEFNREANTLSSKSQDTETTRAAVDMKVLIEQMREQVQNLE